MKANFSISCTAYLEQALTRISQGPISYKSNHITDNSWLSTHNIHCCPQTIEFRINLHSKFIPYFLLHPPQLSPLAPIPCPFPKPFRLRFYADLRSKLKYFSLVLTPLSSFLLFVKLLMFIYLFMTPPLIFLIAILVSKNFSAMASF